MSRTLYLDECVTFDAGQPSIVLGIAVRRSSIAAHSATLQRTVSALVPQMRWRLRATELPQALGQRSKTRPMPTWGYEQRRERVSQLDAWRGDRP